MPAIGISMCTIGWRADRRSYQGPNLVQPLPEVLASIHAAGCDGAELWGPHVAAAGAAVVRSALQRLGLQAPMLSDYFNFTRSPESAAASMAHGLAVLATAVEVGAGAIRIFTGNHRSADATPEQWQRCADCLRELCRSAAPHGIVLAAELHDWNLMDTPEGAERLIALVDQPNMRLIFHPSAFGAATLAAYERLRPHIHHVHASNGLHPLAEGPVPWPDLIERMRSDGWSGHLAIEWFGPDPVAVAQRECAYLRGLLATQQQA
jgi:sugar phosphate isomerase/epimerase